MSAPAIARRKATGTGKDLVARAIHYSGPRKEKAFVAQNCAALPDPLLESELFGHRKGAFTGAVEDKPGLMEEADGRPLFLDEVVETSPGVPAKLLRALEEGEVRRLGEPGPGGGMSASSRPPAATRLERSRPGASGRTSTTPIRVISIDLPPLRERREDIPLPTEHFLRVHSHKLGKSIRGSTPEAMDTLTAHRQPGNVRELENEIERAVALAEPDDRIAPDLLSGRLEEAKRADNLIAEEKALDEGVDRCGRFHMEQALKDSGGNVTRAAGLLGIKR